MSNIQTIRSAIKAKLDTLKGTNKPFNAVYDYYTTKPTSFPVAMFEPTDLVSVVDSTCENQRTYSFDIYILQEMTQEKRNEAIDIVLTAFDDVINAFDRDYTLGGVVLKVDAVPGEFGEAQQDHGSVYYANIKVSCMVLYNIKAD